MKENLNWGLLSKYRTEIYGIATVMIMIFHSQVVVPIPGIFGTINNHLNFGVDIFLLLSGICIYYSFSKDNNYISFMKKRCERTLIPYLVIAPFFWIWQNLIAEFDILDFIYNISGLSLILVRAENYLILGKAQIWFVAFILAMYAIYPFIYKMLFTVSEKKKNINFVLLITISIAFTVFLKYYAPDSFTRAEVAITRIPIFIMGCYLGKTVKEKKKFKIEDYALFLSFIPVKLIQIFIIDKTVSYKLIFQRYLGFFGAFIFIFFIIMFLELTKNIKFIAVPVKKVSSFFGSLSLEIYITHVLIYTIVLYYIPDIRTSSIFTFGQKILIYATILIVSVILSVIYNKGIVAAKNIIKEKKHEIS